MENGSLCTSDNSGLSYNYIRSPHLRTIKHPNSIWAKCQIKKGHYKKKLSLEIIHDKS